MDTRFKIIFDELDKNRNENADDNVSIITQQLQPELDEINELRKLVLDISDPEPQSYTVT